MKVEGRRICTQNSDKSAAHKSMPLVTEREREEERERMSERVREKGGREGGGEREREREKI